MVDKSTPQGRSKPRRWRDAAPRDALPPAPEGQATWVARSRSPNGVVRMDEFARSIKEFNRYLSYTEEESTAKGLPRPVDFSRVVHDHLFGLVRTLGELAPEQVTQPGYITQAKTNQYLRKQLGDAPIQLGEMVDRLGRSPTGARLSREAYKQQLHLLSSTIHAMRSSILPLEDLLPNSRHGLERNSGYYKAVDAFTRAYETDIANGVSLEDEFPHLGAQAEKAKHVKALIVVRDGIDAIFDERFDDAQAGAKLHTLLREYNRAWPRPNAFESPAVKEVITSISAAPTNEKAREAIATISRYTHQFLQDFQKNTLKAYKEDRKPLLESKPRALKQQSDMLQVVQELRWAKAADTLYDHLGAFEAVLASATQPAQSGSWLAFTEAQALRTARGTPEGKH